MMPFYMKYEGIKGSVTSGKYKDWIELESVQLGTFRNPTKSTSGEREADVPSLSEIVVSKQQDNSSNDLLRQVIHGTGKKVIIDFVKDLGKHFTCELNWKTP